MSNGSDQRIRHVAIVLQSLDAATSRGLLAQFPPAQSKQIRHAMVNLGAVTPQERAQAFQSMQGLLGGVPPHTARLQSESPAAALLASHSNSTTDRVEWSDEGRRSAGSTDAAPSQLAPGNNQADTLTSDAFANLNSGRNHSWQQIPIETFAEILHNERPIVIATVINHLSVERATAVVQLLPMEVAGATLAALPHLHMTDAAILKDIEQEIERKIGHHQPQLQASSEGFSRLQAILSGMPESQRGLWLHAVAQSNPILGSRLGWAPTPFPPSAPSEASFSGFATTQPPAVPTFEKTDPPAKPATSAKSSEFTNSTPISDSNSPYEDVFEDPILLPIASKTKPPAKPKPQGETQLVGGTDREGGHANRSVGGTDRLVKSNKQALDGLAAYSDRDFVTVLHSCDPQTVLLAISGASKPWVSRVERLIPAKDIKRLRNKLANLGPIQLRDIDDAQRAILETAESLFLRGKIRAFELATFTAAA